jgi:hypothetical protein
MLRVARLIVAASALSVLCGCYGAGLYRSIGSIPGAAWSDYAFTFFCDTASQLYPAAPEQIDSSMLEALADLGFRDAQAPIRKDDRCVIRVRTPDGRPVRITIAPQNAMTMVTVAIGPVHLGDYQLSRELLRRVALNFGTVMRAFTPIETTLPRRINPLNPIPEPSPPRPLESLKGEGLRPGITQREGAENPEQTVPGSVVPPIIGVPGLGTIPGLGGFVPTINYPNPPYMPYAPWPYTPFNDGSQ